MQFLHEKTVEFQGSILGFEHLNKFIIKIVEVNGSYAYLQSLEDEDIGFIVISPFTFYSDYTFELEEKDKNLIGIQKEEEVAVLNMVTLREPFQDSTSNLLAPLIVNVRNGIGRQIVLPPKTKYSPKEPLFKEEAQVESGEASC